MDEEAIEWLRDLYDELVGQEFYLNSPLPVRQPREGLEHNIMIILGKIRNMANQYDDLAFIRYDVEQAMDDFDHIQYLLGMIDQIVNTDD